MQDVEGAEKEMEAEEAGQCEKVLAVSDVQKFWQLRCKRLHPKRRKMHRRIKRSRRRWMGFA